MNNEKQQLVMDVMDGNPGALTIIQRLMYFTAWYPLLHHLKAKGLVGSALWRAVKDDYGTDWMQFASVQLAQMGLQAPSITDVAAPPEWPRCN